MIRAGNSPDAAKIKASTKPTAPKAIPARDWACHDAPGELAAAWLRMMSDPTPHGSQQGQHRRKVSGSMDAKRFEDRIDQSGRPRPTRCGHCGPKFVPATPTSITSKAAQKGQSGRLKSLRDPHRKVSDTADTCARGVIFYPHMHVLFLFLDGVGLGADDLEWSTL